MQLTVSFRSTSDTSSVSLLGETQAQEKQKSNNCFDLQALPGLSDSGVLGDARRPSCSRCIRSGIECVRGYNVRFRHGLNPSVLPERGSGAGRCEYDFASDQPWLKTAETLSFVDETPEVVDVYDRTLGEVIENENDLSWNHPSTLRPGSVPFASSPSASSIDTSQLVHTSFAHSVGSEDALSPFTRRNFGSPSSAEINSISPTSHPAEQSPTLSRRQRAYTGSSTEVSTQAQSVSDPSFDYPSEFPIVEQTVSHASISSANRLSNSGASPKISSSRPVYPLQDHQEAFLLRHFVEHIASFFDLCDSARHFATVVPLRAASCPSLFNAILATSAKHLSRVSDFDSVTADRYHQECIKILIPTLSDSAAMMDENLLAATVILRFIEEVDVPLSGAESESHLLGTRIFVSAQERSCAFEGLRLAAFWVALRQEIYIAFARCRAVHPEFNSDNINRMLELADDDCTYANRIIVNCAACLQYCFGQSPQTLSTWESLNEYQYQWWREKPMAFEPIWRSESEEAFLPQEWYLSDAVVTGLQHYHLARILLAANNPKIPRLGPGQKIASKAMDEEIKKAVRVLCGIAESNPRTTPAYVNACIAIAMGGDRFTTRQEQEELYHILSRTDRRAAWPTGSVQTRLKDAWGWTDEPSCLNMSIEGILNGSPQNYETVGTW